MRVVLLSRYPNDAEDPRGGVEAVTVVLVKALAQRDDLDVHVVALEPGRTRAAVERNEGTTVHRLPGSSWPQLVDVFFGPGRRRLLRYVRRLRPDVVHTHETYGLGLGQASIPHVFTVHGFDHANLMADSAAHAWLRARLWRWAERRGLAAQKHIIAIAPYVRRMIEPLTRASIHDIDNPVDERFFEIVPQPEPGRILCVGWINERKNTLGSVEAFARLAPRFPEARLVIAGEARETGYLDRVRECIRHHGIGPRVEMPGQVNHIRLMEELAQASVLLLPSRQENAPMAISEAMAAGVPVVAANRCGMPDMVEEGRTGFLVDPGSTGQVAERLALLLSSPQRCRQMGQAGRRVARERFHPRAVAEKTVAVYRQICGAASSSPVGSIVGRE